MGGLNLFNQMKDLIIQWSRAFSLVCEVALKLWFRKSLRVMVSQLISSIPQIFT